MSIRPLLISIISLLPLNLFSDETEKTKKNSFHFGHFMQLVDQHYLPLKVQRQKREIYDQKIIVADSSFDTKLTGILQDRPKGYYDGSYKSIGLKKPLKLLGAEISAGIIQSDGILPVYEQQYETALSGEWGFKFQIPLIKNLLIDSKRYKLSKSRLEQNKSFPELELKKQKIFLDASKKYFSTLYLANTWKVLDSLVDLSQKNIEALKISVKKGDKAQIYLDEATQYLLKRKRNLLEIEGQFAEAYKELSLYLPNEVRKSYEDIQIYDFGMNNFIQEGEKDILNDFLSNFTTADLIDKHPFFSINQTNLEIQELISRIAFNEGLPDLKLAISHSSPIGNELNSSNNKSVLQDERKLVLSLDFPLERNLSKGKQAISIIQEANLKVEKRFFLDQLNQTLSQLKTQLINLNQQKKIAINEMLIAEKLMLAEKSKFQLGESDFFIVNIREQSLSEAQLKIITSVVYLEMKKMETGSGRHPWRGFALP